MNRWRSLVDYAIRTDASTRSSALIRIGLAATLWARWGEELLLYRDTSPVALATAIAFFVFTTTMFFGIASRISSLVCGGIALTLYYYFGHALGRESWTHHHCYLLAIGTLLCAATPCGRSLSVDRWWSGRGGRAMLPERANVWGLRLIAIQLSAMYFWTAVNKTYLAFARGDRLEQYFMWFYWGSDYPQLPLFHEVMALASSGTIVLEYALAFGMFFAKSRRWLVLPGMLMHGAFYVMFPISTFTATVWILYLAFFDPDDVHRVWERLTAPT